MDETRKQMLLQIARGSIEAHLTGRPLPPLPNLDLSREEFGGVFVTLKTAGRLRGCIGRFRSDADLTTTVQQMALASLEDPRFRDLPVTADELPRMHIEISVLSPMERTRDPLSLKLGEHGIYIRQGTATGCFLPQVATEQHWDKETFLSRCCAGKAMLPPDAWKDPACEVHLFTAEVFGEGH